MVNMSTSWKLVRQDSNAQGRTEYLESGEYSVGRGADNKIILESTVVSRRHCLLNVKDDSVTVKDLKSGNGTYVGKKLIPVFIPFPISNGQIIGLGWTEGGAVIKECDKVMFKLVATPNPVKESTDLAQNNISLKPKLIKVKSRNSSSEESEQPPLFNKKQAAKRKISSDSNKGKENKKIRPYSNENDHECNNESNVHNIMDNEVVANFNSTALSSRNDDLSIKQEHESKKRVAEKIPTHKIDTASQKYSADVVSLLSDSESESIFNFGSKKSIKILPEQLILDTVQEQAEGILKEENMKSEIECTVPDDAFPVKQEYQDYDEEAIILDSDSESEVWFMRLSQSSPGKPFIKRSLLFEPTPQQKLHIELINSEEEEEYSEDLIIIPPEPVIEEQLEKLHEGEEKDELDSACVDKPVENAPKTVTTEASRKAVMIEAISLSSPKNKRQSLFSTSGNKSNKSKRKSDRSKTTRSSHNRSERKEERNKKLKEIASKAKTDTALVLTNGLNTSAKQKVNAKVTTTNRGAFLTDPKAITKPAQQQSSPKKTIKSKDRKNSKEKASSSIILEKPTIKPTTEVKVPKASSKETVSGKSKTHKVTKDNRIPIKDVKPLTDSEDSSSIGKPISKVEPLKINKKPKKSVQFSMEPEVRYFEIEPGNNMKKITLCKTALIDVRQMPVFSLEKRFLMMILRWTPRWLDEQIRNESPPPILPHSEPPMSMCHAFTSHEQYVKIVSDLLLMEVWECITQAYMRKRNQENMFQMRLESPPPVPTDKCFGPLNMSVNMSLPKSESKSAPRVGELMLISFGIDKERSSYFFYVQNVRCLPSPPNNIHSFFSISLSVIYTDKMKNLRPGEPMLGKTLSYIKNELVLMEAMEDMACSPLSNVILKPEPYHFHKLNHSHLAEAAKSQWTATLNSSQLEAVEASVSAALGDKPSIQMIQGPPGTGKSSVICAIIMKYYYNEGGTRHQNRGKILICATSNAAVDELVIRLLTIRQSLPKDGRFRMVRVGRAEAMHPRAREVSSHSLALRDVQRQQHDPTRPVLSEEVACLEAKVNSWQTAAENAKHGDPGRAAYCQGRYMHFMQRLNQLRVNGHAGPSNSEPSLQEVLSAEKRFIECANIIVTTLSSAANQKLKCLKRRIALCIVDEAGQAIEPEALIPLTLGVQKLTLIGDPQQLPGYICSPRAKQFGLADSLFGRLSSCTESWKVNPVVLLNTQYRMHPEIADYPNRAFYASRVQNRSLIRKDIPLPPYSMVLISSGDKGQGACGANEMEAWGVSRLVVNLNKMARHLNLNLAVITPYNAHKDLIRKILKSIQGPNEMPIEVNTVDSFQGQERDIVVVSLARSQGAGFLTDTGRMCVMLTRAKHCLLICLNPNAMLRNPQWRTLIEDARRRNIHRYLPNHVCQAVSAEHAQSEDIIRHIRS